MVTQSPPIADFVSSAREWRQKYLIFGLLCAVLVLGAALRLLVLAKAHFVIDGDEAVSGMMALRISRWQELPLFFYGQPYMSPTDAWLAAPFIGFGSGWVKIAPFIWSTLLIWLNYRVASRFFADKWAGLAAATLTAFSNLYLMVNSLRALGSFTLTLVLGDILFLLAYNLVFSTQRHKAVKVSSPKSLVPSPEKAELQTQSSVLSPQYSKSSIVNRQSLILGLVVGFSFYAFWLIGYYYLPVFFFLFLHDKLFFIRRRFVGFWGGFLVGSLPFWLWNIFNDWGTFRYFFESKPGTKPPAGDILNFFFNTGLPLVAGAQNYWQPTSRWISSILLLAYGLALLGWLVMRWRGVAGWFTLSLKHSKPVDMLLFFFLVSPLVYLFSGSGNNAFALPGVDTTGRYLLPLMAVAPILLGGAVRAIVASPLSLVPSRGKVEGRRSKVESQGQSSIVNRQSSIKPSQSSVLNSPTPKSAIYNLQSAISIILLLLVVGCNLYPYLRADFVSAFQSSYFANLRPPLDNNTAIAYLKSQNIEYAVCNHWIGNRLMLDARETIKCVDYYDVVGQKGPERFPELTRAVLQPGQRIGFVLVNPSANVTPLEKRLDELKISYTRQDINPYTIIIPTSRPVDPAEVLNQLGYPY